MARSSRAAAWPNRLIAGCEEIKDGRAVGNTRLGTAEQLGQVEGWALVDGEAAA